MHGKFTMTIEMGNDSMKTKSAVARTLISVGNRIWKDTTETEGIIKDANGNRVGTWEFKEE